LPILEAHSTFARTNSARSASVVRTVSIALSAAPSSDAMALVVQRLEFHPLDRAQIGDELVGLADGADQNRLPFTLTLNVARSGVSDLAASIAVNCTPVTIATTTCARR
jgi:hypothetical protein